MAANQQELPELPLSGTTRTNLRSPASIMAETSGGRTTFSPKVEKGVESISRTVTCTGELPALTCVIPRGEGLNTSPV